MNEIKQLAAAIVKLNKEAYIAYSPVVDDLCNRQADEHELEHCLDGLLDFACDEKMLGLFKKLCRRYYPLYPQSITFYIKAYREMWEEENEEA